MEAKQDLELTIRTATLIKSLSTLIGVRDALIAKLILAEAVMQFSQLSEFVEKCQPTKRAPEKDNTPRRSCP